MKLKYLFSTALVMTALQLPAFAAPATYEEVEESAEVFSEMIEDPDTRIPSWLMQRTQAIAIVTNLKQGGFLFGGRRGDGVMLTRLPNGSWSNPSFINLTGGSVGLQAGFKSGDLVLLFPSQAALNSVISEEFEIGGSVSGTAGPLSKSARESLQAFDEDTVYVYSRSKGLFGGVALEGSKLAVDNKDNRQFYGRPVTVRQIFTDPNLPAPSVVNTLKATLSQAE
ncbi:lipid-binding SYLF domain-containing protein [Lyngbya confervoides]|uniref:Lipid-binding SYLF domain-containing protein n=1 Tax=Lyngbya confervoides BDU141951 TaxID=1574623 RepID=A0ABD4SZY8_9CYAN|nr:lipid-binding SYLF domain-containing protein [Lyngbya confervoides]MCM1981833.1 lipid-binding SYLF domain-containing protein [Lyngbya confervoides BDU141951]